MSTMMAVHGLCSASFGREGISRPAHIEATVRMAHSACDGDKNMGPTGGFIPKYLSKKVRAEKKEKNSDSEANDGGSDRQILEGDGGAERRSDEDQEGSSTETP